MVWNNKLAFLFFTIASLVFAQKDSKDVADSLYANGNFTKAIEVYSKLKPDSNVYDKIAKSYIAIGNYDEALANYKLAIESDPDDALLKYDYAKLLSKTKKFEEAKKEFYDLVYIDYRNPNYHYELGLVLEQLKDSTDMNRFMSAYEFDNNHQKAIFKIAKHYLSKRIHDLSHQYIDQGLSTYANNVELISLKAQNYYWQENYKEAIVWFEKLLEQNESSEFIHEKLSLSYYQEYEYEKALEHRKKVLQFNPYDAVSMYVIGTYYERLQNLEKAEEWIKKALLFLDKPLDAEYAKLGTIYNQQKRYKEAIDMFKVAIKEDPENAYIPFYMVRAQDEYYADPKAKLKVYEDYKKKFPKSPFNRFADMRIKELKEELFLNTETTSDSINKN